MRKLLIALGVFALLGAACASGETDGLPTTSATPGTASSSTATSSTGPGTSTTAAGPDVTTDPDAPRRGGDVVVVDHREPATLNPYLPGGNEPIVGIIGQLHLAGVFDIDPATLELIPDLVTELPTIANGGVVVNADGSMDVTWNLQPEASWSDGVPITAGDMAYTLEYRTATEGCTGFGTPPEPLPDIEVLAAEGKTFVARFAEASLDYQMLFPWLVPSHVVAGTPDICDSWNTEMWPAAGPFVFVEWVRDGDQRHMSFTRNRSYWRRDENDQRLPHLGEAQFVFAETATAGVEMFSRRSADVISPPSTLEGVDFNDWIGAGADVQLVQGPVWEHVNFQFGPANRNEASLNGLLDYRRAIVHAIDRRALLDNAGYPQLEVIDGFLGRFDANASSEPWSEYQPDLDRARQLLAAACEGAGRDCTADPIVVSYSSTANDQFRTDIAAQVQDQLAAVGIDVQLELEDSQAFFGETLGNGTWDMGNWAWAGVSGSAGMVDFFRRLAPAEPPPDGANVYRWGSPGSSVAGEEALIQFELLLDRMRSSVDADEVSDLARQAEELLADQVVIIPLTARAVVGAVWADEIQGFQMNPTMAGYTWNIEEWYRIGG
jgi:peptide/nickel transport system substrate-binding protein